MLASPPGDAEPDRFEPDALAGLPPEAALSRLPPGRHGLPRSFVAGNQRLRIVAAMLRVLPRHGYPATTIGHVTEEAGVSRASFYAQFDNKEDCFLATYDLAAAWLCERVERASAGDREWSSRVRAGVSEALRLLAANPEVAHLIAIEAGRAGSAARQRRRECLNGLAEALRTGRPSGGELPVELEQLLIGGALAHVARYVEADRIEQLADATPALVHYMLIPYLDPVESRRIAEQAA
jgi:TetR/AcrR family transcriptional regulator